MRLGIITGLRPEMIERNGLSTLETSESEFCTVSQFKLGDFDAGYLLPHPKFKITPVFNSKVVNSYRANQLSRDKMKCSKLFIENAIPTPTTVLSASSKELQDFVDEHRVVILKYRYGSGGRYLFILYKSNGGILAESSYGNYKVDFDEDIVLTDHDGKQMRLESPFYAQKYVFTVEHKINNSVLRTYVVGDEVCFGSIRMKSKVQRFGDSIVNIANGAYYEIFEPNSWEIEISLKVAEIIGIEIGVVDFMRDIHGNSLVIECDCDGRQSVVDRKFTILDRSMKYDYNNMILDRMRKITEGATYRV